MEYRNRSKAVKTLLEKDPDYFKKMGSKGGKKTGVLKGFALMKAKDPEKLREVSQRGAEGSNKVRGKKDEQV